MKRSRISRSKRSKRSLDERSEIRVSVQTKNLRFERKDDFIAPSILQQSETHAHDHSDRPL